MNANGKSKYIAALDIGTTTIRCYIFDSNVQIVGIANEQVQLLYPQPGFFEIDPDHIYSVTIATISNAIKNASLKPADISCLGISSQRSTFITWHRETGQPFHNFITWKDLRADALVKKWNSSFTIKTMHGISHCLYLLTRNKRFLAGSVLKLMNAQVTLRLAWVIQNNKELQDAIANKVAMFGTLESWILYRLRRGTDQNRFVEHISDISSCTATGFFDPFTLTWASWALKLFSLKIEMLPKVVDNSYNFGVVDKSIFGHAIPIGCVIGDQSASMWGSCSFNVGDVKVTLGTGSFLNVNTGSQCNASVHGLYPIVAWQCTNPELKQKEVIYAMEGSSNDTGSIIRWAMDFGLFSDPKDSASIAMSVEDSDGVYFIPAFSGLGAPINDHQAASGLIGLKPSTKNAHIVRAVLESIVFRIAQLYACTVEETEFKFSVIKVDGGVSKNDFICQMLADITELHVERSTSTELSVLGAGFLAGLNTGIWKSRDELIKLRQIERTFIPRNDRHKASIRSLECWKRAVDRFKGWYRPTDMENSITT